VFGVGESIVDDAYQSEQRNRNERFQISQHASNFACSRVVKSFTCTWKRRANADPSSTPTIQSSYQSSVIVLRVSKPANMPTSIPNCASPFDSDSTHCHSHLPPFAEPAPNSHFLHPPVVALEHAAAAAVPNSPPPFPDSAPHRDYVPASSPRHTPVPASSCPPSAAAYPAWAAATA